MCYWLLLLVIEKDWKHYNCYLSWLLELDLAISYSNAMGCCNKLEAVMVIRTIRNF